MTVARLLARAAARWPDRVAIRQDEIAFTFAEADALANQVAHEMLAVGVRKDDLVGYLGKNSCDFFLAFWGAAKIGAVFLPLNWRLTSNELDEVLRAMRPAICFADHELIDTAEGLGGAGRIVAVGTRDGAATLPRWAVGQPGTAPAVEVDPDDVALVLLTSGTTGLPKGAMLTGDSLLHVRTHQPADEVWASWGEDGEVVVLAMPLFHIGGIALSLSALAFGAQMVVLREFDARTVLDTVARHRVTRLFLVPAALRLLLDEAARGAHDFSSVRCISYGASPISPELLDECRAVVGGELAQNYGVTESSGTVVVLPPADHVTDNPRLASAGRPLQGVETKVVGPDGSELPAGSVGEILLRARSVMKGYWKDPVATAEVIDADGWLRTGDAGYLDEDGYIYLCARIKDVVISGGENIYPPEIESVLQDHPDVLEAAVFGVPDERWGETLRAEVVLAPGAALSESELGAWLRIRIAAYKVPKTFGFRDALPRNAAGKVLYRVLREPYWTGRQREIG